MNKDNFFFKTGIHPFVAVDGFVEERQLAVGSKVVFSAVPRASPDHTGTT